MPPLNPTSFLPPIRLIGSPELSKDELDSSLVTLHDIYTPQVIGSLDFADLDSPSNDSFERSYVIRWLTKLISFLSLSELETLNNHNRTLQLASTLLALLSGAAAAPPFSRQLTYRVSCAPPLTITIHDDALSASDPSAVGVQTWGSAHFLAQLIAQNPSNFGLVGKSHRPLRILELGCGTGLLSIFITKLLLQLGNTDFLVVASDHHPTVLDNLQQNLLANFTEREAKFITANRLDWREFIDHHHYHSLGHFDLIFGADILYESRHAFWIKHVLLQLLAKPDSNYSPQLSPAFHLLFPLRSTHTAESRTIEDVFPLTSNAKAIDRTLCVESTKSLSYPSGSHDRSYRSESLYQYYLIKWS